MKQKKIGRPEKFNEETTVISFRVPASKAELYREKIHRVISRLKNLRTLILIPFFFMSCEKSEVKMNCFDCKTNQLYGNGPYNYDTCVLEGQRSYRDETFNCYLKN